MSEERTVPFGGGTLTTNIPGFPMSRNQIAQTAADALGATKADMPGLWNLAGHPELTSGQLVAIYMEQHP